LKRNCGLFKMPVSNIWIFKGQEVHFLTLEDGTDMLSPNVLKKITTRRCVISQKCADLIKIAVETWNQGQ
jgi:hypothetical protein